MRGGKKKKKKSDRSQKKGSEQAPGRAMIPDITAEQSEEGQLISIFETLLAESSSAIKLPITRHADRVPSSARAVSMSFVRAVHVFLHRHDLAGRGVAEACREGEACI